MVLNIEYDFTQDTSEYWSGFWDRKGGLGAGGNDPDTSSRTLQEYHRVLWSRELPCGEKLSLQAGFGSNYLVWRNFRFGSDSIAVSFRYERNRDLLKKVEMTVPDYHLYVENFIHKTYTMGGMIIFPKHPNSINQLRGTNSLICDRWDLTLECIRRYYAGEESPLFDVLKKDEDFFQLFVNFRGYVDFFLLQDCVSADYSKVKIWFGKGDFTEDYPMPKTVEDYLEWIRTQVQFVEQRNKRIAKLIKRYGLKL